MTMIIQSWNGGSQVQLVPADTKLFEQEPRVGMVIGTFAAVPYIHLQLEAQRRFYPEVPVLIHDDGSHKVSELSLLCQQYGCDFEYNQQRQPATLGDLSAFLGGLLWASCRNIDILVKVSRRWLFLTNWVESLTALALESQYATFTSYTTSFNFGFRSECVAMALMIWKKDEFLDDVLNHIGKQQSVFVEGYLHGFARRYEKRNGAIAEAWRQAHPMEDDRSGYALWSLLGTDRCTRSPFFLWHDSCTPEDYLALALQWELPYSLTDFMDPNQGAGIEP